MRTPRLACWRRQCCDAVKSGAGPAPASLQHVVGGVLERPARSLLAALCFFIHPPRA